MRALVRFGDAATGVRSSERVLPGVHTVVSYAKQRGRGCWAAERALQVADPSHACLAGHWGACTKAGWGR